MPSHPAIAQLTLAWQVLRDAVGAIFRKPLRNLHVLFGPILARSILARLEYRDIASESPSTLYYIGTLASPVLFVLATAWMAVLWHRLHLTGTPKGYGLRLFLRYCLTELPLFIILVAAALAYFWIDDLMFPFWFGYETTWVGFLWGAPWFMLALYPVMRLSPVLPAVAIGEKMRYAEAWRLSRSATWACFWLAVFQMGLSTLATEVALNLGDGTVQVAFAFVFLLFETVLRIALITALYKRLQAMPPATNLAAIFE